ncbi:GH25 family lysozyme [Nicoliella lavandulae]|uniref:GH25 family lysozyme n=1 Tax=Nicoliella lavandulae TaxID=3082954 RepID=A0ABU8SI67_9LACO
MGKKTQVNQMSRLARTQRVQRKQKVFRWLIIIIMILLGLSGLNWYRNYQYRQLVNFDQRGVVVSQQNSYVDFISLANIGQKFVYIRASQGSLYTDDDFADNYQRSQGANLKVGVYHSFSFNSSATQQFDNFKSEVRQRIGTLPIAVQINTNDVALSHEQVKSVHKFVKLILNTYHRRVLIWTSHGIYQQVRLKHQQTLFCSISNHLSADQSGLKTYNANQILSNDGQSQAFIQLVFIGDHHQWSKYESPNLLNNGGTTIE